MERTGSAEFTKSMRKTHTIYMPMMLYYHNDLLRAAFEYGGYHLEIVPEQDHFCPETYSSVGKDYCACAVNIVGNLLTFLKEHPEQADHIAFLEPQAGGACRAGNYYNLIIESLRKSGFGNVPVLSLNAHGKEKHSGFSINARMLFGAVAGVCYSDLLMTLSQQVKPYEKNKGEAERLRQQWLDRLYGDISHGRKLFNRGRIYKKIVEDFKKIEIDPGRKTSKVGVVGEIYIKFSPVGNYHLEDFLYENACDYRYGGFVNYCIYVVYSEMKNLQLAGKSKALLSLYQLIIDYLCSVQKGINKALKKGGFRHDASFKNLLRIKEDVLSDYYNIGDGWLMAAEICDMIGQGYDRILIVHPFGCLVSHVGGRGIIKTLKERYPGARITSVEYDPEQSRTLRESRIMLAIS